jgi:hypothetical protein
LKDIDFKLKTNSLNVPIVFDSGNAVLGEAFTHTHTPHPQKTDKKVVNKPNRLSPNVNESLAFEQIVLGFLYAHHSNKTNKQKVVSKLNRLLLNVMEFSLFGQTVFGFLYAHYTHKIDNKPNRLLYFSVLGLTSVSFFVCVLYL